MPPQLACAVISPATACIERGGTQHIRAPCMPRAGAAGAAWYPASWDTVCAWLGYDQPPTYYDYGNTVVYQDNSVYVNGQSAARPPSTTTRPPPWPKSGADDNTPAARKIGSP